MSVFSQRYCTTRYDLRGYGRSSFPNAPYSNVEDLESLLNHLHITKAAIVGCSMGANVAVRFAIEHPERVNCLVAAAPGISGWDWPEDRWEPVWSRIQAAIDRDGLVAAVDLALEVWAPLGTQDPAGSKIRTIALDNAQQFRLDEEDMEVLESPPLENLHEITAPSLIVLGDEDVPDISAIGEVLERGIPEARLRVIKGADHVVNMRQPDEFARIVGDFLDQVLGPKAPQDQRPRLLAAHRSTPNHLR